VITPAAHSPYALPFEVVSPRDSASGQATGLVAPDVSEPAAGADAASGASFESASALAGGLRLHPALRDGMSDRPNKMPCDSTQASLGREDSIECPS
jgi:hypothetical protein